MPIIFQPNEQVPEHLAYLCPLCLKNFIFYTPSQLRFSDSFSLDHFPPEDVGGSLLALVCKACNNNAGSYYESKFKETIERECFNKGILNAKIPTTLTITDVRGWHRGYFDIDPDGQYHFGLATKQIKNLPELNEWEKQLSDEWTITVTIHHPDEPKFTKSLLKTAYLYCFNHWGYDFAFSEAGYLIRQVLINEASYPIKIPTICLDSKTQGDIFERIVIGVIFISEPKEMQSIFVNIPIDLKHIGYKCILPIQIPNSTANAVEEMIRINKFILDRKLVTTQIASINFPHPGMENSYLYTWDSLIKQFK